MITVTTTHKVYDHRLPSSTSPQKQTHSPPPPLLRLSLPSRRLWRFMRQASNAEQNRVSTSLEDIKIETYSLLATMAHAAGTHIWTLHSWVVMFSASPFFAAELKHITSMKSLCPRWVAVFSPFLLHRKNASHKHQTLFLVCWWCSLFFLSKKQTITIKDLVPQVGCRWCVWVRSCVGGCEKVEVSRFSDGGSGSNATL